MIKEINKIQKQVAKKLEIEKIKKIKIRVVGIGGGGGNIVSELAQRVKKVSFLAANTDLQALKQVSRKVISFPFGQSLTGGLGTGMNPDLAEMAAEKEREKIKKLFEGQDLVILISCLGGGVGSGATPVFAKILKNLRILNYGIFTLPFKFEAEKKMELAQIALRKIRPKLNAITVLPNESIFQIIDKTTPLKEALSLLNKNLIESLEGLIETIYQPGLINIDFADLRTILEGQGKIAYLNTLSLPKKEGAIKEAIEKMLSLPFYPDGIKGAKGVLFNIVGQRNLSLEEMSQISKTISEKAHKEAKIIFGISQHPSFGGYPKSQNIIKTTIFATGISTKIFSNKTRKTGSRKKIVKKKIEKEIKEIKTPPKKKKIRVVKEPEKKVEVLPEIEARKENKFPTGEVKKKNLAISEEKIKSKIRKSALELKKEVEEEEKKILEKEKFWEIPAFLRKKT